MSETARLRYRSVTLAPLVQQFMPRLRELELSEALALRWRHHGRHVSPTEHEQVLWNSLCNFVVLLGQRPVGIVSACDEDFSNGHCKIAVCAFPGESRAATLRGLLLLINYLFQGWSFRKLYAEVLSYNSSQFHLRSHMGLVEEGRLTEHVFLDGAYHDLIFFSVTRRAWDSAKAHWLPDLFNVAVPDGSLLESDGSVNC